MKQQFTRKLMLLAVMLLAGVGSSFAFEYNGLTYEIIDNNAKTVRVISPSSGSYTQSSIVIPATADFKGNTYDVIAIGESAFNFATSLSSITIPTSVKTIGGYAFKECSNLTSIDLSTIENFGDHILSCCRALTSVTLPASMQSIPNGLLEGCTSMTSFTFPAGVTSIEENAFNGSGLTSITLPDKLTSIGGNAFAYCTQLSPITFPEGLSYIGNNAFYGCSGLTSVETSANYIGDNAFHDCTNLTNVTLWASYINTMTYGTDNYIFAGCNKIDKIICFARNGSDFFGFTNTVKENAKVIVPESQTSSWSSSGFLDVEAAGITNVGGHVVETCATGASMTIFINGKSSDAMYGGAYIIAPGTDVEVEFGFYDPIAELATFTINGVDMMSSVVDNKYTIKSIDGNKNIQATWQEGASYYVNTSYGNCDVFINGNQTWGGGSKYPANKNVTVLIKPYTGYGISSFNVNYTEKKSDLVANSDGSYSYTFNLSSDTNIDIYCAQKWSLTTTFNAGGAVRFDGVSVTSGTTKEMVNPKLDVDIKPNSGYEVASILYNGTEVLNTGWTMRYVDGIYVYPSSDQGTTQTLDITFAIVNPTISANYDTMQGSVSIAGSQLMPTMPQSFAIGSNVTFTITPNLGYEISSVMLNGPTSTDITAAVIANSNSYTISNINDSYTIDVTFAAIPTPATVTATIGTLGMATLYSPYALDFSGVAGLKAYIVSAFTPANNRAILTQVYDVPAKTSVVLVGAAADYTIPTTTTKTYVANLLRGADCDMKMNSTDGVYTNYILADGTNGLGFYVIQDGSTLNAGKAYLAIPNDATSPAPSFVVMNLNGMDVTGIESIEKAASNMAGNAIYNLNGQRQSGLKKGINIVGGKKIVVK